MSPERSRGESTASLPPRTAESFPGLGLFAWAVLLALCAGVVWAEMLPISDFDFGWHVALGRYIVESGAVPTAEPFTHTAAGAPEVAHEWLSEVLYFLAVRTVGILGLRWAHALLAAALLGLVFWLLRRLQVPPALALFGTFAYLVVAQGRFQPRPMLVDLACLLAMYAWAFLRQPRLTGRQLAGAFAAMVVWVNLHSGAVLFAGLAALYAAVETGQQALGWRAPKEEDLGGGRLGRLWALAGVSLAACLATPNHVRLIPYVLETRRLNALYSDEWKPITAYWGSPLMTPFAVEAFWILAVATAAVALWTLRRRSLSKLAVVLVLTFLPLLAERFLSCAFAAVFLVMEELSRALREPRGRRFLTAATAASLLTVAAAAHPALDHQGMLDRFTGRLRADWNFMPALFPLGAVDVLEATGLKARLYNPSAWGGYLLLRTYRDYPVFIDGRWLSTGEKVLRDSQAILARGADAFALLDEYRVDLALLPREWMTGDLQRERGWLPVFENYNSGLYLRKGPATAGDLAKVAAYYQAQGVPFDPEKGFDERAALEANSVWAGAHQVGREHFNRDNSQILSAW